MEKDNKVVLGAVLILLVGMLSFNFNSLTGQAVKGQEAVVTANPSNVYFTADDLNKGTKLVAVTVKVNSGKVDNELYLYRKSAQGEERVNAQDSICKGTATYCGKGTYTVNYKFSSGNEEGDYFFKVQKRDFARRDRLTFDSNVVSVTHFEPSYRGI
jgi:hypothetical protein